MRRCSLSRSAALWMICGWSSLLLIGAAESGQSQLPLSNEQIQQINQQWTNTDITSKLYRLIQVNDIGTMIHVLQQQPSYAHVRSGDGRGPMWWAYEYNRHSVISLLREHRVSDVLRDRDGYTPMDLYGGEQHQQRQEQGEGGGGATLTTEKEEGMEEEELQRLLRRASELSSTEHNGGVKSSEYRQVWKRLRSLRPRNAEANYQYGIILVLQGGGEKKSGVAKGIELVRRTVDPKYVDDPVALNHPLGLMISSFVGRYYHEEKMTQTALPIVERGSAANPNDICLALMSATMVLYQTPNSLAQEDGIISTYLERTERLLERLIVEPDWVLDEQVLSEYPGAGPDPYLHCMINMFHLSFYYRADVALAASRFYQLSTRIWPDLNYVADRAKIWMGASTRPSTKERVQRKIRLGIVSPNFTTRHSVVEDFKGTMSRLDRTLFNITYIYIDEKVQPVDPFVYKYSDDKLLVLRKEQSDVGNGAWMKRWYPTIEELELDILFYLDLTMGPITTRLAMAKLAPVQAVSHGHPLTSGIPPTIMDYYISWGLAELEYDIASTHYTEELKLLPTKSLHQYYTPRAGENVSMIDGMNYRSLVDGGRAETFPDIAPDGHWYTCMQKPFKLFPEMDPLICGVLRDDPLGRIVLHRNAKESQTIFINRLSRAGCDTARIYFLDELPHHQLLALYALSDVILDSYPAGGCTTTREVLAIGKALVTLPARFLGGRWSYAYYHVMGDDVLNRLVIAESPEEYVMLAVKLGTSAEIRNEAERRIKNSVDALYERWDSVQAWNEVLLDISPVIIDDHYYLDGSSDLSFISKDEL